MCKSSKTKKKWCRATKKGRSKSKWVIPQRSSTYERECRKTDFKKIVLADKNLIDRKMGFLHGIKADDGVRIRVIPNQLHGIVDGAALWPTIELKAPKRTEFGSKPVRAKITYFDIVKRVATKDEAEAFRNKSLTPER